VCTCDDSELQFILHFHFQQWNNVILWDFVTANLVTKNSAETIVISGTKYTNNSVILSSAAYENLPIPKYTHLFALWSIEYPRFSKNVYLQIDDSPMYHGSNHSGS